LDETVKIYIEEFLTTFSGFHQTVFSFLTAHSLQQLFSTAYSPQQLFLQPQSNQTDPKHEHDGLRAGLGRRSCVLGRGLQDGLARFEHVWVCLVQPFSDQLSDNLVVQKICL
jgi:hypothetical protein